MKCENCECKHSGEYGSGRFCSTKCSRGFATKSKRKEINEKVSLAAKRNQPRSYVDIVCKQCKLKITVRIAKRSQKTCSLSCSTKWRWNEENPDYQKHLETARKAGLKSAIAQSETRRSKNEIMFADLCKENFENVLCNVAMFDGWDADVIIPEIKTAIHWNGKWHYEKLTEKHSVEQVQNRDRIKYAKIEKVGYNNYIIKDLGKEDKKFVEEQFEKFKMLMSRSSIWLERRSHQ